MSSIDIAARKAAPRAADTTADRWAAVLGKDARQDGEFVYAVRTTGVYCRPSCPARPAKRSNVEFFDTTQLAEAAGYRACKRCKPDGVSQARQRQAMVERACAAIERSESPIALERLAGEAGLSPYHFHRIFKEITGLTPVEYRHSVQSRRVTGALRKARSVTEAIYDAGFNSSGRFYAHARERLGMSPRSFRAGGAGEEIRYATTPCALGILLVAATQRGICLIAFDDTPDALTGVLHEIFPRARLISGDEIFARWVKAIVEHIEQPHGVLDLPLDVQGTVFQQRVWKALREIPVGETATYTEVAKRIGEPRAVRAVAHACASNRLAVAIPCHRVVRSDGSLAGYRWGVERKAELLRREAEG